jgi:hypothetical protein
MIGCCEMDPGLYLWISILFLMFLVAISYFYQKNDGIIMNKLGIM